MELESLGHLEDMLNHESITFKGEADYEDRTFIEKRYEDDFLD